jgi:transposase-like protein
MPGGSSRRYPPELRERAVRMVAEISTTRSGRRSVRSPGSSTLADGINQLQCSTAADQRC